MGSLNETANWDESVPYFAADAILTGGPDCPDNIPIQALTNRTAFLKKQLDDAVSGALVIMTAKKLQTARTIAMTGDGSWSVSFDGAGNVTAVMTLANSGVGAGTYPVVTVDAKGRVTGGRALTAADVPAVDVSKITGAASQTYVQQAIANLLNGAPGALDTLQELAAALGNDASFATTVTNALAKKADKTDLATVGLKPGSLIATFATTPPAGGLVCNGAAVSRTTYAALFAAIGTKYGAGDGATTFNLPNIPEGFALLAGSDASIGAQVVGAVLAHTHTAAADAQGSHKHTINDPGHGHAIPMSGGYSGGTGWVLPGHSGGVQGTGSYGASANGTGISLNDAGQHIHNITVASTGGSNNLAAGIKLLICISY